MLPRTPSLFPGDPEPTATPSSQPIIAHCDGGARGNPGPSGYGAEITDAHGNVLAELSEFLGFRTNNFAEYSGLLATLQYALDHGHRSLRVISDSLLMVKQIQGAYKVKSPDLLPLWQEAKRRIAKLDRFEITHALRHKNKAADRLANEAMDQGMHRGSDAHHTTRGSLAETQPTVPRSADTTAARTRLPPLPVPAISSPGEQPAPTAPAAIEPALHLPPRPNRAAHAPIILTPDPPATGRAQPAPAPPARPDPKPAAAMLRGFTRDGAVHLLGTDKLPDGIFVKIIPE